MERTNVEAFAEPFLRPAPHRQDRHPIDLVGARLPRHHDVPVHFGDQLGARHAGHPLHVLDGGLPAPAQRVDPGVHDEPGGAPDLAAQVAEAIVRVLHEAGFCGELLGIRRPALRTGRERQHPPEQRQPGQLLCETNLRVVPGNRFVTGQGADGEPGEPAHVAEVDVQDRRLRVVQRSRLVRGDGRVPLPGRREALDDEGRLRAAREEIPGEAFGLSDDGPEILEDPLASRAVVTEEPRHPVPP